MRLAIDVDAHTIYSHVLEADVHVNIYFKNISNNEK